MAYFPASCDHDCKDCSQNKCGWCAFLDRPCGFTLAEKTANEAVIIEPYNYSTTIISKEGEE